MFKFTFHYRILAQTCLKKKIIVNRAKFNQRINVPKFMLNCYSLKACNKFINGKLPFELQLGKKYSFN